MFSWAAKEALLKALPATLRPTWKDVSIVKDSDGKPIVHWESAVLAEQNLDAHLSVSHDGEHLVVGVVVERRG